MNLRYLVPALGIIAVSVPITNAEDKAAPAPVITFSGWIDSVLNVSTANKPDNLPATAKDDKALAIGFTNEASLKANVRIGNNVSGKVNIYFSPGDNSDVNVREAYANWAFAPDFSLQAGKYINPIGWISPEPTGLYTVHNSLIGYLGAYGHDVIGVNVDWAHRDLKTKEECPLTGSVHLTNGYFTAADAASVTPFGATGTGTGKTTTRGNSDLGYGLDLTYNLPGDRNFVNFDFAYDPHGAFFALYSIGVASGAIPFTAPAGDEGGDALLVGLNGQYHVTPDLLIAAEIINLSIGNEKATTGTVNDTGGTRTQGLVLANWTVPKAKVPFPIGITGEIQYITDKQKGAGSKEKASEETLAVQTNPTGSDFFGLNGELSFTQYTNPLPATSKVNAVVISAELLLSF